MLIYTLLLNFEKKLFFIGQKGKQKTDDQPRAQEQAGPSSVQAGRGYI